MSMGLSANIYKLLYRRWGRMPAADERGYTLLLLTPGDLPVFLKIAMDVCGRQDSTGRVETLVLPDVASAAFTQAYEGYKKSWPDERIRVVPLTALESIPVKKFQNPHLNCWLQFITGIRNTRSAYAMWHDADLFINDGSFHRRHYEQIAARQLACLGVNRAWDKRFAELGYHQLVATWELAFDVAWARGFKPWQHRGHDALLGGKPVTYDIAFCPMAQTPPEKTAVHDGAESCFVHFNYVIGSYRKFQRAWKSGATYEDQHFRMLLVRLLIDAYDDSGWQYEVPAVAGLAEGLAGAAARVAYPPQVRGQWAEFRRKFQGLLDSPIVDAAKKAKLADGIGVFDRVLN
jgi:hypothetical protein